jgi:hypothetical protein
MHEIPAVAAKIEHVEESNALQLALTFPKMHRQSETSENAIINQLNGFTRTLPSYL